ncbi:hypothetical protein NG895_04860 [Aeoliella sp. ICT_H6.2]|uniref:Uncharacterized protein n=1 Tax=Aeoliella straminimaris TaxID=2954799 RepID=A0A9X2JG80_9BACT|nr:hypothetical protein [Aeoliella straminimaris]MCO6043228.1 hypothetical protein [Aeoliella straminimaris]
MLIIRSVRRGYLSDIVKLTPVDLCGAGALRGLSDDAAEGAIHLSLI